MGSTSLANALQNGLGGQVRPNPWSLCLVSDDAERKLQDLGWAEFQPYLDGQAYHYLSFGSGPGRKDATLPADEGEARQPAAW